MLSLLRSEWFQVRKSLPIKIVFAVTLIASFIFGMQILNENYSAELIQFGRQYVLYGGGSLCGSIEDGAVGLLFASLLAGWIVGGSFENCTIQGAISYGKSRAKVFLSKMLIYLAVCSILCLAYWSESLVAFFKNGLGTEEVVGNLCHVQYIIGVLIAGLIAYASLFSICGLVGFLTRKTGATMGICFAVILFGGNLLAAVLSEKIVSFINYTPLGLYNQIVKINVAWFDIGQTICVSIIWLAAICGIGLLKFKKTELK